MDSALGSIIFCSDASGGLTPIAKALDKSGTKLLDTGGGGKKWSQWSPLGALVSTKNEKKRTLDDTYIEVHTKGFALVTNSTWNILVFVVIE